MKLLKFPDPLLLQKCEEVTDFDQNLLSQLDDMWRTMINSHGMGLAANQVGITKRMFVMVAPGYERVYIVNPVIIGKSEVPANLSEGCLSAPGESLTIDKRKDSVTIIFNDETGKNKMRTFTGIHAVCVQHEIDHLDGISFLASEGLSRQQRRAIKRKWGIG